MARHGENIRKRNDGRWEARYPHFDAKKGRKIYRSVYGSTYGEAKERRNAAMQEAERTYDGAAKSLRRENNAIPIQICFSQAAAEWLSEVSDKCKYSTYIKYRNVYRVHLEGVLGPSLLSNTFNQEIQEKLSDYLCEKDLSISICRSICCIANQILKFAKRKYLFNVPTLKPETSKQIKEPVTTLSKAEQAKILTNIYNKPDKSGIAVLLCLYTGMRLGELCALKWSDFDFMNKTVTVSRTVQRIAINGNIDKTALMESPPKSQCSRRTIPLVAEIIRLLEDIKGEELYVFGGDKAFEPRTMQYRFKRFLNIAGIEDRNFHILRHTFATNCIESGMDAKILSVILGHSDVKITLNHYVHPTMESKRKQLGLLPDFYGQLCGQVA